MSGTKSIRVENITPFAIWVFDGEKEHAIPFSEFPCLKKAPIHELMCPTLSNEFHLRWESLDVDIDLRSLSHLEDYPLYFESTAHSMVAEEPAEYTAKKQAQSMPESTFIPTERVEQAIYLIRGQKVMLDRDLAALYGVETKALNQAVKRNADRFPTDFVFKLSTEEKNELVTFCDRFNTMKHSSSAPLVFTEQGVAMLSGVLRSPRAAEVNITIMRTFVKMRRMLESSEELSRKLAELESKYDEQFRRVFDAIRELMIPPESKNKPIGFHVREEQAVYQVRKISEDNKK